METWIDSPEYAAYKALERRLRAPWWQQGLWPPVVAVIAGTVVGR